MLWRNCDVLGVVAKTKFMRFINNTPQDWQQQGGTATLSHMDKVRKHYYIWQDLHLLGVSVWKEVQPSKGKWKLR